MGCLHKVGEVETRVVAEKRPGQRGDHGGLDHAALGRGVIEKVKFLPVTA